MSELWLQQESKKSLLGWIERALAAERGHGYEPRWHEQGEAGDVEHVLNLVWRGMGLLDAGSSACNCLLA